MITAEQRRVVIRAARAQGCTCDPDLIDRGGGNIGMAHDDWCPLVRVMNEREPEGRFQGILYRPGEH